MKTLKEQMDEIKVESYKDCVWYLEDLDKCKLPGLDGALYSGCYCKDKEMEEFCIWVTKFLKSKCPNTDRDNYWKGYDAELPMVVFGEDFKENIELETSLGEKINNLLKKLHIIS